MVKRGAPKGFVGSITVHVSPFVPKPSTPFQLFPMNATDELKKKISQLKRAFGKVDNTYFTHESVKYSFIQGVLARGDRKLGDIILKLADGESLSGIIRDSAINMNFYALRQRNKNELLPWSFISNESTKKHIQG
jgi:radical SAM superfamily enzyme YgiQ (UPF0313 family)